MPVDWLAAAGVIDRFIGAAVSMETFGLCQQYRKAVEEGRVRVEELSETSLNARLGAGARNLPSLPTRGLIGTDLIDINENLKLFEDPFTGETLVACRALRPGRRPVHAHRCDEHGQRPDRADDRLARPRDLPEGREEDDRHVRGDRRLRGAAPQPRPHRAARASASTRSSRCPTAPTRPRSSRSTVRHGASTSSGSRSRATRTQTRQFLRAVRPRARDTQADYLDAVGGAERADGGDPTVSELRRTTRSTRSCARRSPPSSRTATRSATAWRRSSRSPRSCSPG